MSDGDSRRVMAEIRFGEDRVGVSKVGGRSIHQYWSLLSPHFRDVFLAPQRRSDDGGVSWSWREPSEKKAIAVADLAGVRNRLERAKESFEENPVNPLMGETRGGGASSQEMIDQVAGRVKAMADGLIAMPDVALTEFVCRTETGVMVHSWGLVTAAKIHYPDSLESGVSGIVVFGGKGSAGNEVVIENAKGLRVARTVTDEAGEFRFSKVAAGRYRVRVISGPGEFSSKGVTANVERGEVTRLELRSTSDPEVPGGENADANGTRASVSSTSAPLAVRKRRGLGVAVAIGLLLLLLVGGGVWGWRSWKTLGSDQPKTAVHFSSMTPEKFSNEKANTPGADLPRAVTSDGGGLAASVDGVGGLRSQSSARAASMDVPHAPSATSASGNGRTASKIGSRIELSGVGANNLGSKTSDSQSVASGSTADATSGDAAQADNFSSNISDSNPSGVAGPSADITPNTSAKTGIASLPGSNNPKPSGRAAVEALTGHLPAGQGGSEPNSPAGLEKARKPPSVNTTGLVTMRKAKAGGEDQDNGAAISDKNKAGDSQSDDAVIKGEGRSTTDGAILTTSSAQAPVVAVSVAEKNTSSKQDLSSEQSQQTSSVANRFDSNIPNKTHGKNAAGAAGANQAIEPQRGNADEPPESKDPEAKASSDGALLPSEPSTLANSQSSAEKGSNSLPVAASGNQESSTHAEAAPTAQAEGKDKSSSSKEKVATAKKNAAALPSVPKAPHDGAASTSASAGAEAGVTLARQKPLPGAEAPVPSQKEQRKAAEKLLEKTPPAENAEPSRTVQSRGTTAARTGSLRNVGAVRLTRWAMRMERDIIVPTMPMPEGDPDVTEVMKQKLREDQKARLPETLKQPALQYGISFKFIGGAKVQPLQWIDTAVKDASFAIYDGRAEVSWDAAAPLRDCVISLAFGDGSEAACVGFDHEGRASVELRPELRAALWFGAMYSVNDDARTNSMPRFSWQVLRGPLASSAWFNDGNWFDGAGCRLDIVLNGSAPAHTVIALVDQVTGWMLATELE